MRKLPQSGYTLVELMIAITISVTLSVVIMGYMADQLRTGTIASARSELLSQAQSGLDEVGNTIRLSANADLNNRWQDPYAPNPADAFSWASNGTTLILATAAQDHSGNILFDDPSKYITDKNNNIYFVRDGTLYKRILANPVSGNKAATTCPEAQASSSCPPDKVILEHVSAFSVEYRNGLDQSVVPTNARSIILHITLTIKKYGQDINASYTTRMVYRND